MIKEQPQERKSFVDRIIAPTAEDEARALQLFQRLFEDRELRKLEKTKKPGQIEIIQQINAALSEFLRIYGADHIKEIPPDKIRILDAGALSDEQKKSVDGWSFSGRYIAESQEIIIIPSESELHDIKTIIHEMLHVNSFLSFDLGRFPPSSNANYESELSARRVGFNVYGMSNNQFVSAFHTIDEAVIEELTKEFYYKFVSTIPSLAKLFNDIETHNAENDLNDSDIIDWKTTQLPDETWRSTVWSFGYKQERSDLWDLIDDILENDKSKEFKSREDIFKLFVQAQMTGRLLPLGRVIKRVYGKGAFKFLGENTRNIKKVD